MSYMFLETIKFKISEEMEGHYRYNKIDTNM